MARRPQTITHWQEVVFLTTLLIFAWLGRGLFPIPVEAAANFELIEKAHASDGPLQRRFSQRCGDLQAEPLLQASAIEAGGFD